MKKLNIGIIGGGAAGFFSAVDIASVYPNHSVTILEKTDKILSKVKISGGGRCNISNACFNTEELIKNYPRGNKELKSVFHKFGPADTIEWFESKGIKLKTEKDNRIFPLSNKSDTIVDFFIQQANKSNVEIIKNYSVKEIIKTDSGFTINPESKFSVNFDKLIVTTGGNSKPEFYSIFEKLGHTIIPPVASLFTFNTNNHPLKGLEGISLENVSVKIKDTKLISRGAILITHWGFSGPAILKLSAFGARIINSSGYNFSIKINWIPDFKDIKNYFYKIKSESQNQKISSHSNFNLPLRLWKRLLSIAGIGDDLKWTEISKERLEKLESVLTDCNFRVKGKTTFKEEFVTAGGINLKEINFKTMESKICKGLFFAGEILDIDGITGGFNFQSCWSTAYIASRNIVSEK